MDTDDLIRKLSADAAPVRRLPPPALRSAVWVALILGLAAALVLLRADLESFARRTDDLQSAAAWLCALATGVAAIVASAFAALPDRPRAWACLPAPFLAGWLALSGLGCLGLPSASQGHSDMCLVFILATGAPVGTFLIWRLHRARPLNPGLVGLLAALGAAGLSATLLQFFHPFAITWLDLGFHLLGSAAVVGAGAVASWVTGSMSSSRAGSKVRF